jgi:hypothetical protein
MIAKNFTQFLLARRKNAILIALIFSVLPLFNWVSAVIVAAITFTKGAQEGFVVLLWSVLPVVVLLFSHPSSSFLWANNILFLGLFTWLLASLFNRFHQWNLIIEVAISLGIASIILIHLWAPHLSTWWYKQLLQYLQQLSLPIDATLKQAHIKSIAQSLSLYATGIKAAGIIGVSLMSLMCARFLQSQIDSSIAWKKEWKSLRLQKSTTILALAFITCAFFNLTPYTHLLKDILPIILCPFLLTSFSLSHSLFQLWKVTRRGLLLFYTGFLICTLFFPFCWFILIGASMLDSFLDFRTLLIPSQK